jgi:hypothetical protein
MPADLEKQIGVQQMADLPYLRAGHQATGCCLALACCAPRNRIL